MSERRSESVRVLIAGGGTGGHVFPALAIKQGIAIREPEARVWFVGTRRGLEATVMPAQGETLKTLWISGFSRAHLLRNLLLPLKLMVAFAQSAALLLRFRPQVVIGTGGYVMGPILWLAQILRIPTLLQEQNSRPGYTTRRLARRATVVCVASEDAKAWLSSRRTEVTGNPLRTSFRAVDRAEALKRWPLDATRKTILIFGGSAGARSINEATARALPALLEHHNLIWQTGRLGVPRSADPVVIRAATENRRLIIREFIEDMPGAYGAADLAVCRSGAITLAELAMCGLGAILIPYPFATDDHQTANARPVVEQGAARMIRDADLNPDSLLTAIRQCTESEASLADMARRMKTLARPDAAARIAEIALSVAKRS